MTSCGIQVLKPANLCSRSNCSSWASVALLALVSAGTLLPIGMRVGQVSQPVPGHRPNNTYMHDLPCSAHLVVALFAVWGPPRENPGPRPDNRDFHISRLLCTTVRFSVVLCLHRVSWCLWFGVCWCCWAAAVFGRAWACARTLGFEDGDALLGGRAPFLQRADLLSSWSQTLHTVSSSMILGSLATKES